VEVFRVTPGARPHIQQIMTSKARAAPQRTRGRLRQHERCDFTPRRCGERSGLREISFFRALMNCGAKNVETRTIGEEARLARAGPRLLSDYFSACCCALSR